jgi:hypothetical protein
MRARSDHRRTNQSIWFILFLLLSPLGSCLLVHSMGHPGQFVDEALLLAGLLVAFALFSLLLAIKPHFRWRASTGRPQSGFFGPKKIPHTRKGYL